MEHFLAWTVHQKFQNFSGSELYHIICIFTLSFTPKRKHMFAKMCPTGLIWDNIMFGSFKTQTAAWRPGEKYRLIIKSRLWTTF